MGLIDSLIDTPETVELRAVYEDDVSEYLESLELREEVVSGQVVCPICGDQITEENIGAFVPREDEIDIICDKTECLAKSDNGT